MFKSQFISFHSLHLGLVFIFTLLIAANSWADELKQKKFEGVEIDEIPDQTYTADSICPTPDIDVPDSLKPFVKDTDYKVYCHDNVNAGEATLVVEGIGNYADSIKTFFIIKRAPLTVTAKNDTITYGEEPSNAGVEYSGFVGDDDENSLDDSLIFSYEYGQYGRPGDYAIIPSGPRSENYEIEFVEGKLTVEPKKLTVTAKNDTIVYGDEPSNAGVEYSGFVGDDDESSLDDSLIFSYEYGQYGKPGVYAIIPSGPRSDKYEIEFVEGKLTVLPKKLTVTAKNDTITYGEEPSNAGVEYSGFVGDDDESSLDDSLIFSYEYGQYGKPGDYAIIPSGPRSDKYEIEFVEGKLTVLPKKLTVTAQNDTIVYGDEPSNAGVEYSGFVGDDDESSLDDSLIFSYEYGQYGNPGVYAIIPSGPRSDKYEIEFVEGKLTVLPKKLTVTAKNDTIVYGDEPSNAGVEYSGFVGDDDESSLDDSLIFSYEYGQYGRPGDYAIIPSGPRSKNYDITFVEGVLTVEPKRISIVWKNDTLFTYDGETHAPNATADGVVNNDSCGLTITGAATNAGKYTAKVTELSNKNYKLPATGLEQAFEIKKANSSIVKAPTAIENLVYNGKVQTLVTAGEAQNGTFVYKLASEEAYSESLPTAKDAGTYTIYFMVQGNENYNSTEAQKITATIEKAPESSSSSVVVSSSSELPKSSSSSVVVSSSSEEVESSSSEATTPLEIARNASALKIAFAQNELMVTTAAASELKVFIFDMQGNLKKVYRGNTAGNHSIQLNKMSRGMYLARVVSGSSVQTLRVNVK